MKYIKRKLTAVIPKANGAVVNTRNIESKKSNALSIEQMDKENTYSTEETFTGKYWIDGRPLYRKVYSVPEITPLGAWSEALPLNTNEIIKLYGVTTMDGVTMPLPIVNNSDIGFQNILYTDATNIYINNGARRTTANGYAIIEYTKTTDVEVVE